MTYRRQIGEAVRAIQVTSSTSFTWLKQPACRPEPTFTEFAARSYLRDQMTARLYRSFYCPGGVRAINDARELQSADQPGAIELLSQVNTGTGCWTDGWTVQGREGDTVLIEHGGVVFRAHRQDVRMIGESAAAQVRIPPERRNAVPGFYIAMANLPLTDGPTIRTYWNLAHRAAETFIAAGTDLVNSNAVPAQLKVVNQESERRDCAVLYLPRSAFATRADDSLSPAIRVISRLHVLLADQLRDGVPSLTKRIAFGLGAAEDPLSGRSFGEERCTMIADAVMAQKPDPYLSAEDRLAAILDHVEASLAAAGSSLEQPYLSNHHGFIDDDVLSAWTLTS